jgi:hypothetical protein
MGLVIVKESAICDNLPAHQEKVANHRHQGVNVCVGTFGHHVGLNIFDNPCLWLWMA